MKVTQIGSWIVKSGGYFEFLIIQNCSLFWIRFYMILLQILVINFVTWLARNFMAVVLKKSDWRLLFVLESGSYSCCFGEAELSILFLIQNSHVFAVEIVLKLWLVQQESLRRLGFLKPSWRLIGSILESLNFWKVVCNLLTSNLVAF